MSESENKADIVPVRMGRNTGFQFECHKGVSCFTKCCRGIDIILTPYDIIRLKNKLELPSEEFLAIYTVPQLYEKTDLPVVTLKLLDDDIRSCPFVRDEGCLVYDDRPTTCRYYPLGVGNLSHGEEGGDDDKDFFFFVNEPHCKGFDEKKEWTVDSWRKDQGVDIHDEINAGWTDLIVRKRSFPPNIKWTPKAKEMFFMACYNIDAFKRFVFESPFLTKFEVDEAMLEKIKTDDIALLEFGLLWLKDVFFLKKDENKQFKVKK
ncbi:YkgJ family cysteine cluster protein [Desulfoluna sp.]|uniref:YkgJ family cysteine cluster protein n=1 Tax=Desulfoluna sp. TaxID=2045199 RepID=UPI00261D4C9D|nr:YkgJ family cysteine cluster protein [Desulfoluna sp.]